MLKCLSIIIGLLFASVQVQCDKDVIFAAVLYRHGLRTPVQPYPNDPYKNESMWPFKFGELVNDGKMQHFRLGQWLKKRYSHILSPDFDPNEIYVLSTDVDRTLMSAQANLAGMYPPTNRSKWNQNLEWQPIPVHTIPSKFDALLHMEVECPAYEVEKSKLEQSEFYQDLIKKYKPIFEYVSEHAGLEINDFVQLEYVYSTLKIEKAFKLKLPEWAEKVYDDMGKVACISFKMETFTEKMARLKAGPLLSEITYHMRKAARKYLTALFANAGILKKMKEMKEPIITQAFNVVIYSAHDETVANILNTLQVFDNNCPTYTATVLLELVNYRNNLAVRVSYRNSVDIVDPTVLNIPDCGETCTLSKFISLYRDVIPNDWKNECRRTNYGCDEENTLCQFGLLTIFLMVCLWTYMLVRVPYNTVLAKLVVSRKVYRPMSMSFPTNPEVAR